VQRGVQQAVQVALLLRAKAAARLHFQVAGIIELLSGLLAGVVDDLGGQAADDCTQGVTVVAYGESPVQCVPCGPRRLLDSSC